MAELVCPSGHQVVAVPGDGKDYEGECDACGRKLRLNRVNPVDLAYVHPNRQDAVQTQRQSWEQKVGAAPAPEAQQVPGDQHG